MFTAQWGGSMCLTETQAGSDVGAVRSGPKVGRARPLGDGSYAISGTKIFISGGDHDPPPDPDRPRRLDWQALLMRVHKIDVLVCHSCGGHLRVIAFLTDTKVVRRILHHLGTQQPPPGARARSPPASSIAFPSMIHSSTRPPSKTDAHITSL
jgi:hypothetical protein